MNIFFLDTNPQVAASYLCTAHLSKMILESAQLLSTTCNVLLGESVEGLYKSTHVNHPSAIWLRQSLGNIIWLYHHAKQMNSIRIDNGASPHKSFSICRLAYDLLINKVHQYYELTDIYLAVTPELKEKYGYVIEDGNYLAIPDNAVLAYREYYCSKQFKKKEIKWYNDNVPYWYSKLNME